MGRAHMETNLVPAELEKGISSLLPQNIVISEPIPGCAPEMKLCIPLEKDGSGKGKCGASSS